MVCKKIRKAREYPSQSKRSASLRRCIQRGTVQSRCTTQVHGDRKNAHLLVCCQHFLHFGDCILEMLSNVHLPKRWPLAPQRLLFDQYPGHKSTQPGTITYSSFQILCSFDCWQNRLNCERNLRSKICAYHFGVCSGAGKNQKHQAMQPM